MINRTILVGRLTKDITLKMSSGGKKVTHFTLAVNRRGKDAGADFISCTAWEQVAELLSQYTHKGSQIGVEGRIQTSSYQDANTGQMVYDYAVVVENITFLDSREKAPEEATETHVPGVSITDEELPF